MAVIWERTVQREDGSGVDHYEVRSAGQSRRLYTNGVFHSQFNPARPVAGSVWDLLLLPAFFHSAASLQRVLVLGVGGGAVIRQLLTFFPHLQITGVELNPVHVSVARDHFSLPVDRVNLITADAHQWVKDYRGESFDLVIEDVFGECNGEPIRAIDADQDWCLAVLRLVAERGTLVMNFDSPARVAESYWGSVAHLRPHWQRVYLLETPLYQNQVLAMTRLKTDRRSLVKHLRQYPKLDDRKATCALNYRLHSVRLPAFSDAAQ